MSAYRKGLPVRPSRIAALPLNDKGYPVPWFVEWIDGKPDFRVMDAHKLMRAIKYRLCWICGEPLGRRFTFVAGPMCGVNRTSAEPPSHRECATYAARACPFLTLPKAVRREAGMPEQSIAPAGMMIARNPGVAMLWTTDKYSVFRVGTGILIQIGEALDVEWLAEGRAATRAEVEESVRTGLPTLETVAREDSASAVAHLARLVEGFTKYLPEQRT